MSQALDELQNLVTEERGAIHQELKRQETLLEQNYLVFQLVLSVMIQFL